MDPGASNALNNIGVIQWASGDRTRAASSFHEALRIHPDNKVYLMNTVCSEYAGGEVERAVRLCRGFLARHPDRAVQGLLEKITGRNGTGIPDRLCLDIVPGNTLTEVFQKPPPPKNS